MTRRTLAFVLAALLAAAPVWATSFQYTSPGTAITFADTGGTAMTFSNRASGTGQVSALADKGAGDQPSLWQAQCSISLTGTNTQGQQLEYYVATSQDGTTIDGALTMNSSFTTDQRRNLTLIGVLQVDQASTNTTMVATFRNIYLPARYFAVGFWNGTSLPTETSTTKHKCVFTPVPFRMQNT